MVEDALLYIGQKAFIRNQNDEVLVLNDPITGFDLPGGKVLQGETDFEESLKREVKEETGLDIKVGRPFASWYYEVPKTGGHRHAGKKLYVIAFSCTTTSDSVQISDEHDQFEWVKSNKLKDLKHTKDYEEMINKYLALTDD